MNVSAMYKGERVIAAQQEVDDMTMHLRRLLSVSKNVDTARPYAWDLPHLRSRPKKKQLETDRQREIGIENSQLMRRLARAMKGGAVDPAHATKYRDMVVQSQEASRRKAHATLATQNAKLASALLSQQPHYSTGAMREAEAERQAVLASMSRAERRRKNGRAMEGLYRSQVTLLGLDTRKPATPAAPLPGGARARQPRQLPLDYGAEELARELSAGILFKSGIDESFRLRTARQMREEVARAQGRGGGGGGGGAQQSSGGSCAQQQWRRHSGGSGGGGTVGSGGSGGSKHSALVLHVSHVPGEAAPGNLVLCHTLRDPSCGPDGCKVGFVGSGGSRSGSVARSKGET